MAVRDGRLELDDDGHVVDGGMPVALTDAAPADVVEDTTDQGAPARARSWARRHRLVSALAATVALALVAAGALVVLHPGRVDRIDARVEPVALTPPVEPRAPLVGEYRVTSSTPVRAVGLVGPGVRSSTAVLSDDGALEVTAVPDCDDPSSLDVRAGSSYAVRLESATSQTVVPLPAGDVDWSDALRRACWLQRSAEGLALTDVRTRAGDDGRLVVDLQLSNGTGRPVLAGAVDAAGSAAVTLAVDDVARVPVGVAVATCRPGRLGAQAAVPARLSLSVGPPGSAPLAEVALYLSPAQRAQVAAAAAERCGPAPDVTVRVVAAAPAPPDRTVTDATAATVDLRVSVDGDDGGPAVLGVAGRGFTAEARREFSSTVVDLPGTAALRWSARCESAAAPVLPLSVQRGSITWSLRVVLDDPRLLSARAAACAQRERA